MIEEADLRVCLFKFIVRSEKRVSGIVGR